MATTVKTKQKFSRLTPTEELIVRTLEGEPIPKKLKNELLRLKKIENESKAKKAKAKKKRRTSAW